MSDPFLAGLQAVRLPEGGRAALSFPVHENTPGGWADAQERAFRGASRANILQHWTELPAWLRQDSGFQCLMDLYCPVDLEGLDIQRRRFAQDAHERLRQHGGSAFADRMAERLGFLPGAFGQGLQLKPSYAARQFLAEPTDEEVLEALRTLPVQHACLDFGVTFGGGTAISTNSTTRTIAGVKTPANQALRNWGVDIGFDGTTSTNAPAICQLSTCTFATNAPGTNSTSVTPSPNDSGRPETIQSTCGKAWTAEPTVLSAIELFLVPSYMGSGIIFAPLTKPAVGKGGNGIALTITQASGVTCNGTGTVKSEE